MRTPCPWVCGLAVWVASIPTTVRADFLGITWLGYVYRIDSSTNHATRIADLGFNYNGMTVLPDGRIIVSQSRQTEADYLYEVDPFTGASSLLIQTNLSEIRALAAAPDGRLFATSGGGTGNRLFEIDLSTGVGTDLGSPQFGALQAMEFAPSGSLYAWDTNSDYGRIDLAGPTFVDLSPEPIAFFFQTMAFAPDGRLFLFNRDTTGEFFRANPLTGELMQTRQLTFDPASFGATDIRGVVWIPTPGMSISMILTGCAARCVTGGDVE